MDTSMLPKRHQYGRAEARWKVLFFTPNTQIKAETVNIRPEGVLISCHELPPLEDDFRILIKPPDRHPLDVTGRVVWTTICSQIDGGELLGADVQFVSVSEKDLCYLQGKFAEHAKEQVASIAQDQKSRPEAQTPKGHKQNQSPNLGDVRVPVFYNKGGKTVQGLGSHFSSNGCFLYTKLAPPKGGVFSLKMKNPRTGKSIRVDSSVIRCKRRTGKKQWGMVVRFMNLTKTDREEISQILQHATDNFTRAKGAKYLKTKIGQAILGHFGRKRSTV